MEITNSRSVNMIIEAIEAFVYPTCKKVSICDTMATMTLPLLFLLLPSGKTDFSFSLCGSLPHFQPNHLCFP